MSPHSLQAAVGQVGQAPALALELEQALALAQEAAKRSRAASFESCEKSGHQLQKKWFCPVLVRQWLCSPGSCHARLE